MNRLRTKATTVFAASVLGSFAVMLLGGYALLSWSCRGNQVCLGWSAHILFPYLLPSLAIFLAVSIGLGLVASYMTYRKMMGLKTSIAVSKISTVVGVLTTSALFVTVNMRDALLQKGPQSLLDTVSLTADSFVREIKMIPKAPIVIGALAVISTASPFLLVVISKSVRTKYFVSIVSMLASSWFLAEIYYDPIQSDMRHEEVDIFGALALFFCMACTVTIFVLLCMRLLRLSPGRGASAIRQSEAKDKE